jgi:lipoprotein NlpD
MISFLPLRPLVLTAAALALLSACTSSVRAPAPVEDRTGTRRLSQAPGSAAVTPPNDVAKLMPGSENAGKPGYYTVQRGDTLMRIGLENGLGWRDLALWNNLANPDVIEVGQVLRVTPPGSAVETAGVVVRPIPPQGSAPVTAAPAKAEPAPVVQNNVVHDEGLGFIWPANGALLAGFDEAKNKGLDIGGRAGDSVMASADGQVVYAGSGLRGYGNLIILKHNSTFLTAYAHNQALLVKEDQKVRKGQKIAEMGKSDTDRVKLHFEVRKQGKPVDPAKFLPAR